MTNLELFDRVALLAQVPDTGQEEVFAVAENNKKQQDFTKGERLVWEEMVGHPEVAAAGISQNPDQLRDAFNLSFRLILTEQMVEEEWKRQYAETAYAIQRGDRHLARVPEIRNFVANWLDKGWEETPDLLELANKDLLPPIRHTLRIRLRLYVQNLGNKPGVTERLEEECRQEYRYHPVTLAAKRRELVDAVMRSEEIKFAKDFCKNMLPQFTQVIRRVLELDTEHDPRETLRIISAHEPESSVHPREFASLTESELKLIPKAGFVKGRLTTINEKGAETLALILMNYKAMKRVYETGGSLIDYHLHVETIDGTSFNVATSIVEFPDLGRYRVWEFGYEAAP